MLVLMSIDVCVKVGRRIRALRHERKMSQEVLSALADLS